MHNKETQQAARDTEYATCNKRCTTNSVYTQKTKNFAQTAHHKQHTPNSMKTHETIHKRTSKRTCEQTRKRIREGIKMTNEHKHKSSSSDLDRRNATRRQTHSHNE